MLISKKDNKITTLDKWCSRFPYADATWEKCLWVTHRENGAPLAIPDKASVAQAATTEKNSNLVWDAKLPVWQNMSWKKLKPKLATEIYFSFSFKSLALYCVKYLVV